MKAYLLADPERKELDFSHQEVLTLLELPSAQPDPYVSVVVLEYEHRPRITEGVVARSVYGGFSLTPSNAQELIGSKYLEPPSRRGSVPPHIQVKEKSIYSWRIYADRAGPMEVDLSYSFQGEKGHGSIKITSQTGTLKASFEPTGMYVGEPNSNWHIESYNSHHLGRLHFHSPGYYTIRLEIEPGSEEELAFQWLWLEARQSTE